MQITVYKTKTHETSVVVEHLTLSGSHSEHLHRYDTIRDTRV